MTVVWMDCDVIWWQLEFSYHGLYVPSIYYHLRRVNCSQKLLQMNFCYLREWMRLQHWNT